MNVKSITEMAVKHLTIKSYNNHEFIDLCLPKRYDHLTLNKCCNTKWITHELDTLEMIDLNDESIIGDKIFRPNLKKITSNVDFYKWIDVSDDCEIILNYVKEKNHEDEENDYYDIYRK